MTTSSGQATENPTLRSSIPPLRTWLRTFVIGLFMGSADAVPGVSGGTIALIAGIYERLIAAVTAVTPGRLVAGLRSLAPVDGGVAVDDAIAVFEEVDGWFLIALLAGIATAVFAVTGIVDWANDRYPVALYGVFFGFIAASAVILLRAIDVDSGEEIAAAVAGFVIAFLASGASAVIDGGGLVLVFLAGLVSVSAMILPGISGSLMLIIIGQHARMSEALHAFVDALIAGARGGSTAAITDHGTIVVTFIGGGLIGLFTVARVVRRALDANRSATLAFLVALVVGALRAPVVRIGDKGIAWTNETITVFAVAALIGGVAVLILDWYAVDIDLDTV